ncbi:hypothetical protein Bpfe_002875 [Biomphalaria pfeifferi]|uniref:Uncharacterized protein n=2 Tax=Biomphalaria pfeifferi TaxID=112525 RepID=A0AAD8C984_BIOPF|nr:hypothetical protein Bpfe_002875 [Biomphalaria pfeifferi]
MKQLIKSFTYKDVFPSRLQPFTSVKESEHEDSEVEAFKKKIEHEVDFESSEKTCTKNYGHPGFIPVTELKTSHFPEEYQDQDLVDTIKLLGDLTVKIIVTVSDKVKIGSGRIFELTKSTQKGTCPCSDCRNNSKHTQNWWEIVVLTSIHVVNNKEDAENTKCRLFYDTEDSSLVNLEGAMVENSSQNKNNQICRLICVTCDEVLSNRIDDLLKKFIENYEKVFDKFWDVKNSEKLVVIVSHPHGTPKKVTIGKSDERKKISDGHSVLTYSTNTCPGSAGAFLYIL